MANIRLVTQTELQPILDLFADLEWPIPYDQADNLINQLGWQRIDDGIAQSNLPVSATDSTIGRLGDEISDVYFRVSDLVHEDDHEAQAAVAAGFPVMVDTISACLGFLPTGNLRYLDGFCWDLPTDGRIDLSLAESHRTLHLTVEAPRSVALELSTIKYGGSVDEL